jgi:hypothetical protein
MECEEVRHQLAARLTGNLHDVDEPGIAEHLAGCEACRDEAAALSETWLALDAVPAKPADSAAMRARFETALDLYRDGVSHGQPSGTWDRLNTWMSGWWPSRPVLQFGIAVMFLAAGLLVGAERRSAPVPVSADAPTIAELRQELHDTREMVMLSLLQQSSAAERLRGVTWSEQLDRPGNAVMNALLDSLGHDPNVNVRLACVDALRRFGNDPRVRKGAIQTLADASAPLVQIALIDFMVETGEREAVTTLRRLADDATQAEAVRGRAAWGVDQLS